MRPCLIVLIVLSAVLSGTGTINATITVIPSVVVALINDSTFFNCSTTSAKVEWLLGSNQYSQPVIYSYGKVKPIYVDRFRVENYANSFGNHFNLIFHNVTRRDAGRYICLDPGSQERKEVHLNVLETQPICGSNISVNGLIGPNSCSIKPDTVQLSCSVRYIGNQVPELQWTKVGENMTINSSICLDSGNVYTCYLTMETELQMEGDSYICQTTQSRTRQYNCTSDVFRIIYVFGEHTELSRTVNDKVNCSVSDSSQSCNLSWIFENDTTNWTESHESVMEFKRPGRFICQANCILRNGICTFTAITVKASAIASPQDLDLCAFCYTTKIIAGVVAAAAALGIVVGIFFFCRRKKKRQHGPTDASEEERSEEVPLVGLDGGNDISDTIGPMQDEHRDKKFKGLTILNDELYVAFETSPVIEIFHIDISRPTIPTSTRSVNVKDLINPGAIAACARNTCLYIVDKRHDDGKQIIRFDPNGTVICAWKTHKDDRGRISVNHDGNVVMTVYDKHMLKIYSPEGKLETKKTVYFCGWRYLRFCKPTVKYIFHAINLDDGNFILCHGIYKSKLHRVCKVDPTGKVLQSFGGEEGSDEAQLSSPAYLAKRHDGSILVADQKNHRIILLSSELAFEDVLFTKKKHGVSFPTSMYVSEKTGSSLLFLGCNRTESPRGYVSVLKLSQ